MPRVAQRGVDVLRRILRPARRLFDRFITSRGFLSYQAGAMDMCLHDPEVTKLYEGHEFVLFRRHYYLPLPDAKDLEFLRDSDLVGVAIDDNACFEFHKKFVQPFHARPLRELPEVTSIIESYVQEVDLSVFEALQAGDILFIDSTHTVRPGGDVAWEICEILPRLKPGVLVHVHDISLPKPYPSHTLANNWYWMEQYMLQAFLAFNERVSILWPGNYLMVRHEQRMRSLFEPEYSMMRAAFPLAEPASFWMRIN